MMISTVKKTTRKRRGRGEGSIYQRADGRWCATVSAGYNGSGRRRRKTIYGQTKRDVQEKLKRLDPAAVIRDASALTVRDFLKRWIDNTARPAVAPTTYQRYEQIARLQVIPYVGGVRLTSLAAIHVEQLYADLRRDGVSPRGIQMAGTLLQTALRHAVRLGLISHNPCQNVRKPRTAKAEMRVLTAGQVAVFLKAAESDRLYAMYYLAIATGMRQGELFGLKWADIDFEGRSVFVQRTLEEISGKLRLKETKSVKGRRRIELPQRAVAALTAHRKRMLAEGNISAPVFCDATGGHLRRPNVHRRSFYPILKRAQLPRIRFHDLRHTAATLLLLAGVHAKIVSERLGHASIEITLNTYSHVLPTMQREAADKLDRLLA